ncbi:MAG: flagellin [Leptospirillia bacterium]
MALTVTTNVSSLSAQRSLSRTGAKLGVSLQRLASGLRINSAKDDAAGLAISQRMTTQIRGLNQAARNANDGVSLAQTAEGALGEMNGALQRLRELAIQSANGTNSSSDRAALQSEASQLTSEISLIATTTEFNGLKLLDGSFGTAAFHVGANANQTISVTMTDSRTSVLGANASVTSTGNDISASPLTAGTVIAASPALTINGTTITTSGDGLSTTDAAYSANAYAAAINAQSATTSVTATAGSTTLTLGTVAADANGLTGDDFQINGVNITVAAITSGDGTGALTAAINAVSNQTGVTAALDGSNNLVLTASDGRNIQVTADAGGSGNNDQAVFSNFSLTNTGDLDYVAVGTISLSSDNAIVVGGGLGGSTEGMTLAANTYAVSTTNAVANIDVSTVNGANTALSTVDRALDTLNSNRATLGSIQTRFESTINRLTTTSENLSAARSRIVDADFAAETAELTRGQILQQAGVAILAQANQRPQLALSLLQ